MFATRNATGASNLGGRPMPMYNSYMNEGQRSGGAMSREEANKTSFIPQQEWGANGRRRPAPSPRSPVEDAIEGSESNRRYVRNNGSFLQNDSTSNAGYSSPVTRKVTS